MGCLRIDGWFSFTSACGRGEKSHLYRSLGSDAADTRPIQQNGEAARLRIDGPIIVSRHSRIEDETPAVATSPHLIAAREELAHLKPPAIWQIQSADFTFRVHCQGQSL